jgi:hypothetical protein
MTGIKGDLCENCIPRVKSTHVVVALHAAVHYSAVTLLRNALFYDCRIGPVWEAPVLLRNLAPFNFRLCVVANSLFEGCIEISVIKEDVRVVIPPIEVPLKGLDGLDDAVQFFIPGQDYNRRVCAGSARVGFKAAYCERLIVLVADFPTTRQLQLKWAMCWRAHTVSEGVALLQAS